MQIVGYPGLVSEFLGYGLDGKPWHPLVQEVPRLPVSLDSELVQLSISAR